MSEAVEAVEARSLWFTAPRRAELRNETVPAPGEAEVRVRAAASAPSGGTEMLVYRGEAPADAALDLPTLEGSFGFPIKYGYALSGRIEELGEKVEGMAVGDPVFVHHPHQSRLTVPASYVVPLPTGIDPSIGVFAANLETAVNIVHDSPLKLGETALVFGQGVVGLLVAQLLRLAGAGAVLTVDPLESRRRLALALGADGALTPGEGLVEEVLAATGGRGADVAVEASGAGEALQDAVEAVAVEGTVVVASWYGTKPVDLSLGQNFHRGRVTLRSSQVGMLNPALSPRWDHARRTRTVVEFLEDPRLRLGALVSHRVPFERAPDAYRLIEDRPAGLAQVLLTYEGEQ
ncbi:zinc-dependent alcohol dehydrogenase [Rubrobacter aplysinae]|uniref:zinc-dependent alcohol dehydrogenase n=1 Tax=Rubrobacter aplysinae TaxID=909625 RepID=UPI00064BE9CB|nr:zinc-binding alcohol dehydrogenase [Rubrobacter aplysinae]